MTKTAEAVAHAITGELSKAPIGATAPTDATTVLDAAFVGLGHISDDGVSLDPDETTQKTRAWGGQVVRAVTSESSLSLGLTLIEYTGEVLEAFWRGSAVTEPGAGNFTFSIQAPTPDPSAWVLDFVDGLKRYRFYVPRGEIIDRGEITLATGDAIGHEITIECLPDANQDLMIPFSTDVNWSAS